MGESTGISWCNHTFNPWHGCAKVSAECTNCYAETTGARFGVQWGVNAPRKFFGDKHWNEPRKWNAAAEDAGERRRVFCASMADVFEDRRDLDEHRARLWTLIDETPQLDWLLLTKRPENAAVMLPWDCGVLPKIPPWPNVWLGVTAGTRETMDRVQILRMIPAVVRFISCEPILEPITAEDWNLALRPRILNDEESARASEGLRVTSGIFTRPMIDWLIVGDESGSKRRNAQVDWVRTAREAALRHGVAFHFKQWNGAEVGGIASATKRDAARKIHLPILDGRQWAQFPNTGARK